MTDEYRKNPANVLAEIIKPRLAREAKFGLEVAEDIDEQIAKQIAKWRNYFNEQVECGPRDPREPLIRHVWRVIPPE